MTPTSVLIVCNDRQLIQVLLNPSLQLLLQLLDSLLPSTLRIQNLIIHVNFLLGFNILVILTLSLLLKHYLSFIFVLPDKLALPRLLLLKTFLQALGFVLSLLQLL